MKEQWTKLGLRCCLSRIRGIYLLIITFTYWHWAIINNINMYKKHVFAMNYISALSKFIKKRFLFGNGRRRVRFTIINTRERIRRYSKFLNKQSTISIVFTTRSYPIFCSNGTKSFANYATLTNTQVCGKEEKETVELWTFSWICLITQTGVQQSVSLIRN